MLFDLYQPTSKICLFPNHPRSPKTKSQNYFHFPYSPSNPYQSPNPHSTQP